MWRCSIYSTSDVASSLIVSHNYVRVKLGAPKTLYVLEPEDSIIRYPRARVYSKSLELRPGSETNLMTFHLRTSTKEKIASTFCKTCGVHIMQAQHPLSASIFVNVLCLDTKTFISKPVSVSKKTKTTLKKPRSQKSEAASTAEEEPTPEFVAPREVAIEETKAMSPTSSESYGELVDQVEEDFTVTAASSISKSFMTSDDRSTGTDLELAAYKLRKALSPSKKEAVDTGMMSSYMEVPTPSQEIAQEEDGKPAATNTSYEEEEDVEKEPSPEEKLRRYLSKHL